MTTCDLNCDMGEGVGNDAAIFPFITSANIACGFHAGNEQTMAETIDLAKQFKVAIGAHPSFPDKENFGRTEIKDIKPQQVYDMVLTQVQLLAKIATMQNATVHHVKPHGALYNMAARDQMLAMAIAHAVYDHNNKLILYGLSGSYLISEGRSLGLRTASEVFADRTYRDDGSLTPRSQPNTLIEDEAVSKAQALKMVQSGLVVSTTGKDIKLLAETICLHGDGEHAVAFAKTINTALTNAHIKLKTI